VERRRIHSATPSRASTSRKGRASSGCRSSSGTRTTHWRSTPTAPGYPVRMRRGTTAWTIQAGRRVS